jgi:hypothetical protein
MIDGELSLQHPERFIDAGQDACLFRENLHRDYRIKPGVHNDRRCQNEITVGVIAIRHSFVESEQRGRKLARQRFVEDPGASGICVGMILHHVPV